MGGGVGVGEVGGGARGMHDMTKCTMNDSQIHTNC